LAKFTPKQEARRMQNRLKKLNTLLLTAMNRTLPKVKKLVLSQHMNASPRATRTAVRKQSGKLRKSVTFTPAVRGVGGAVAVSTFRISAPYAGVHIGKRGAKTRITARRGNLAIPTKFARYASGVPIGTGPRDPRFNIKFVAKTRTGSKVMFGTMKGKSGVLPLFTLKRSVVVPTRIDTRKDIVRPAQAIYNRIVREGLGKALA